MNNVVTKVPRYMCQKILPLVYDESLSYYEYLCKLTDKMNEMIDVFYGNLSDRVREIIYEKFNDLFVEVAYDEPNKRLRLTLNTVVIADGEHIYTPNDETMTIK